MQPHDARRLLEWQSAAGVDLAVGEVPVDRFAASLAPTRSAPKPAASVPQAAAQVRASAGEPQEAASPGEAAALAQSAATLEDLQRVLDAFDGCPLKLRATQLVFADGNPEADIMFVGEAPGREEDLQGKPFVGRAGQLLDRMLAAIGLDRTKVYIANTVPWRPPGNRTPTQSEIAACLPFLHRQIELVDPRIVVTVGAPATQTLFETNQSISRMRGQWRELTLGGQTRKGLPMLHPAYLLRQPAQKQLAWRDLLTLRQGLAESAQEG